MHSWSNVFADDGTHVIFLDNFKTIAQAPNDYTLVTLQVRCGLGFTLLFSFSFFCNLNLILFPPFLISSFPGGRDKRRAG